MAQVTILCANPVCQKPFQVYASTLKHAKVKCCSPACKYDLMRTTVPVACENPACGKTFRIRPRDLTFKHHYCSEACWHSKTAEQRFWEKVDISAGPEACWPWTGGSNNKGYGHFTDEANQQWTPHRYVYALTYGSIPDNLFVCHTCDVRKCCNPAHLFLGTNTDNMQDASTKGRTNQGEKAPTAKLTTEDVYEIRALQGKQSAAETARQFSIGWMQVYRIWRRERWKHLP